MALMIAQSYEASDLCHLESRCVKANGSCLFLEAIPKVFNPFKVFKIHGVSHFVALIVAGLSFVVHLVFAP